MIKLLKWEVNNFWIKCSYIVFLVILLFPYYRISEAPEAGIDNSWRIALELAKAKGLVFGKDIIYTYGPLGALTQRFAITSTHFDFFLFDLFFFINLGLLLYFFLPKSLKLYQLIIHFIVLFFVSSMYGEWIHFLLFYSSIFFGLRFIKTQKQWLLFYAIFLGAINFFIKANYGIVGLGFLITLLIYSFFTQRLSLKFFLSYTVGMAIFIGILAFVLKTEVFNYFYSSLKVISGYNEAQSLFPENRLRLVIVSFAIWVCFLALGSIYIIRDFLHYKTLNINLLDNVFFWGCGAFIAFILIKYSFVRADDGHITAFVKLASLPFLLLVFLSNNTFLRIGSWGIVSLNILSYFFFYQSIFGNITFSIPSNLRTKSFILPQYFKDIFHTPQPKLVATYPKEVLDMIGNKTVDIIPNEVSEIYFNNLNYNPRPTLQSYQAYNNYLDLKNREKYLSANAPDYVIYGVESTDNKYAWGDETQTLLALLQRYKPVKLWDKRLLLEQQKITKKLKLLSQKTTTVRFGEEITFPLDTTTHRLSVIKIKTSYTWFGKLLNLFFQPPHFSLTITTENGKRASYNSIPVLLEKGLLINTKVDSVQEVKQFFEQNSVTNKAVKSINLQEIVRYQSGFSHEFELIQEFYELK